MTNRKLSVISLFSGSGGMDLGFLQTAKYEIILANDIFKEAVQTYEHNIGQHIVLDDIVNFKGLPTADIVIGGPPCQGFSLGNPNRAIDDPRNWLFKEYIRVLHEVNPAMFVMENVQGMRTLANGQLYEFIKKELETAGFKIKDDVLNAIDFGVPQHRRRNFIVGIRNDLNITYRFPSPLVYPPLQGRFLTVADAILHPPIPIGCPNHEPSKLTLLNQERLKHIPQGGAMKDIPEHLRNNSDPKRAMRRLAFNEASPTIVHNNCDHYYHPTEPRRVTIREMARIQTYPDSHVFFGCKSEQSIQVANSVPVKLASAVAESVYEAMTKTLIHGQKAAKVLDEVHQGS